MAGPGEFFSQIEVVGLLAAVLHVLAGQDKHPSREAGLPQHTQEGDEETM